MTTTEQRPQVDAEHIRKEGWIVSGAPAPTWFFVGTLVLLVIITVAVVIGVTQINSIKKAVGGTTLPNATGQITIAKPTTANWKVSAANTTEYCTIYIPDLNNAQLGPVSVFGATLLADAAPNQAARNAALRLYKTVASGKQATQAQIDAVNKAYACPS